MLFPVAEEVEVLRVVCVMVVLPDVVLVVVVTLEFGKHQPLPLFAVEFQKQKLKLSQTLLIGYNPHGPIVEMHTLLPVLVIQVQLEFGQSCWL